MKLGDELAVPFDKSRSHPAALSTKKYGISKVELFKACMSREFLLMRRNSFVYAFAMTKVSKISNLVVLQLKYEQHFYLCLRETSNSQCRLNLIYLFYLFFQLIFMALLAMTVFLRTKMHKDTISDGGIVMGAIYFTLMLNMFNGMSEIPLTIMNLPVFYKQRDLRFFPSWAYALPTLILKIPVSLLESALWVSLTYYVIGFDPNAGR